MAEELRTRTFTKEQARQILEVALQKQTAGDDTLNDAELREMAQELGIAPDRLEAAIAQQAKDAALVGVKRQAWREFYVHAACYTVVTLGLLSLTIGAPGGDLWKTIFMLPALGWGAGLAAHWWSTFSTPPAELAQRQERRRCRREARRLSRPGPV